MLSKFLRAPFKPNLVAIAIIARRLPPKIIHVRSTFIPPSQYDIPMSKKFHLGHVMKVYWETIPLFISTFIALAILAYAILYACRHKMDVVFTSHSRENISRTMDLRNPSVHKVITINQRYEPWPEMQDVLDKMRVAERRALSRAQTCSFP